MTVFQVQALVATLALVAAGSCSKQKGDSLPAANDVGVAGSRDLSSLKLDDVTQLCKELNAMAEQTLTHAELLNEKCFATVVADDGARWALNSDQKFKADARHDCDQRLEACKHNLPSSSSIDCKAMARVSECKGVTVEQLKSCIQKTMRVRKKTAGRDLCALFKPGEGISSLIAEVQVGARDEPCLLDLARHCPGGLGGSRREISDDDPKGAEIVAKFEGFAKQMCDCIDIACGNEVNDRFTKWGQEMAKTEEKDLAKPTPEIVKMTSEAAEKYSKCYSRLGGATGEGGATGK